VAQRDIIAIGASAGGHRALQQLFAQVPADFPATWLVAVHLARSRNSILADLLDQAGPLPATFARDGEVMLRAHIYVAPADRHMMVADGHLLVRRGPTENSMRPAIDPLFRSVAVQFGGRAIGLLLTGMLSDGVSGLRAIKRCGGITVAQDPNDAEYRDLPANAIQGGEVDHVVRLAAMRDLLVRLVKEPAGPSPAPPEDLRLEVAMAAQADLGIEGPALLGRQTVLTCPDCNGALWEIHDGDLARYRCHVGHAYTLDALEMAQANSFDRALSSALRALNERVQLMRRLAEHSRRHGHQHSAEHWEERFREYDRQAALVREALLGGRVEAKPDEALPALRDL
jgi:two-component system chemotaxis response regulator CheB